MPSPLATRPGGEGMRGAEPLSCSALPLQCSTGVFSCRERGSPCVFSVYCSQLLFHASPPSSCFAQGRKALWKFLAASPFLLALSLLPPFAVAIKSIVNLSATFQSRPPHPPPMFSFYPSQDCITSSVQSSAIYWDHHRGGCLIGKPQHIQLPSTGH